MDHQPTQLTQKQLVGEALYIARPLAHCILARFAVHNSSNQDFCRSCIKQVSQFSIPTKNYCGFLKSIAELKKSKISLEVGGLVLISLGKHKELENHPKIVPTLVVIFWGSIPCVVCLCVRY